jgi:hypothetical protein
LDQLFRIFDKDGDGSIDFKVLQKPSKPSLLSIPSPTHPHTSPTFIVIFKSTITDLGKFRIK